MATIKSNILLNGLNTVTGIIFPIITFPYAARVLLPEGIGTVNFLNSIISYIVLLTSLGIPMYAVREVAKYRDNIEKRNSITIEIIILSTILCLLGYIAVWALAKFVPQIHRQSSLFYILSLSIIFTGIGVNWFYQGIEDFKYITVRGIIIRCVAASALFIFVKSPADLLIYGTIIVGSTVGNNLLNFVHLNKYLKITKSKIRYQNIIRHIKPITHIFLLNLIVSFYSQLNPIILGFLSNEENVGYFIGASRITQISLTIMSSINAVLLPKCSNLLKNEQINQFKSIIFKSRDLILWLCFPMAGGIVVLSSSIIHAFCGNNFEASISVLCLSAPTMIFISITAFTSVQILYPMDKVNTIIICTICGAIINVFVSFIIVPNYGANGSAISTLIAETVVFLLQILIARRYLPFKFSSLLNLKYLSASILMMLIVYMVISRVDSDISKLIMGCLVGVASYVSILYIERDYLTREVLTSIISKFIRK